ncbi:MAG: hypothetical protein M3Y41_09525 [Pseudomonadota bacterium]|nr:hypothetical protein [Pseudomonadota bacterium]
MLDRTSGHISEELGTCGDADDVFFDGQRQRIYVSCGSGEIAVFQRAGTTYRPLTSIRTAAGARTSLFVPDLDRLFVARRANGPVKGAAILVYRPAS